MRRRLVFAWLLFAALLLVVLEVPLGIQSARRERDAALGSLQREAQVLAAATEEVVEGRSPATAVRRLVPEDARLVVVEPGAPPPGGRLHDHLAAALRGEVRSGRAHGVLYATTPVGEAAEHHGALGLVRRAEELDEEVGKAWLVLAAIAVAVLGAAAAAGAVLARSVARPLDRLRATAAAFGAGELSARTGHLEGAPEVVALAETFDEMAARIERLVRSQQAFVADASHQLRTPLTALRLRLETLDAAPPDVLDAAVAETHRLSRLVDALLALARADGRRPASVDVDVGAVLGERVVQWAPLAAEHGIALGVDAEPRVHALLPDGVLEQVVDGYLDNALEVAPHGSTVALRARRVGGAVEVVVADEGPGLAEDDLGRAFDRFWRANPAGEGIGLGLAIVRQLVEAAGGSSWLRRRPGGGTEAGITVPDSRHG